MCRNNLEKYNFSISNDLDFLIFDTWHSIEIQYEGDHESSLDGEDGDGEGGDDLVGVVHADDHQWRQGARVGKFAEKETKNLFENQKLKFKSCSRWASNSIFQLCQFSKKAAEN